MPGRKYLYRYEAKRIQTWILATDKVQDIKGGSECVERLAELADRLLGGELTVFVRTAGNGVFELDEDQLHRFAALWPLVVARHAPDLELVQAWAPHNGTVEGRKRAYDEVIRRMSAAPRSSPVRVPQAGPFSARSGRTGRPAVKSVHKHEGGLLDAATKRKHELAGGSTQRFLNRVAPERQGRRLEFDDDLDRWGASFVAVIHADGNGIGNVFKNLGLGEVKDRSSKLNDATTCAVRDALGALADREPARRGKLRARVIVVGGDDVTVIVPGEHGLPFTDMYLRAFERETTGIFDRPLTASAGIALVKPHFPFRQAYALAEELCTEAKDRFNREQTGLAFHRVTTSQLASYDDIVEETLTYRGPADGSYIATRTYTLADLRALDRLTGTVDGRGSDAAGAAILSGPDRRRPRLSRGALRAWLRLAVRNRTRANARWQRFREVSEVNAKGLVTDFDGYLERLGVEKPNDSPWDGDHRTALGDALAWATVQPLLEGETRRLWEVE